MTVPLQLCVLLLYALCQTALSQDRVWLSSTPTSLGSPLTHADDATLTSAIGPPTEQNEQEEEDAGSDKLVPQENMAHSEISQQSSGNFLGELEEFVQNVLSQKDNTTKEEEDKKEKARKWMSVPPVNEASASLNPVNSSELPLESLEPIENSVSGDVSPEETDLPYDGDASEGLSDYDNTELGVPSEDDVPMLLETVIRKKTTVIVSITEPLGEEDISFVNLTGIRNFTGEERRMVAGCLDLSDLLIDGEEAKEVIQRMSKHTFHRLDLSGNAVSELPANTFSPVAYSVRDLRLDHNPLLSNSRRLPSPLQRGGHFHLTELRELNLSSCALEDIDFFTPWNSNHLEVVDLSCNRLSTVPTNLQFFHNLKKLFLQGNPITQVGELPFALLWNMQTLSLSSCMISCISGDPLRNMDRLKELNLAGNNLTHISEVRLARGCVGVHMYLSGNPWHCGCDILTFVERYHYAIRDLEDIRCGSPRWLEGLRTAYLTKEILSLDSLDGDCSPAWLEGAAPGAHTHHPHFSHLRVDRLQLFSLAAFALAALVTVMHLLCGKKKEKYRRLPEDQEDINYIKIQKTPYFK